MAIVTVSVQTIEAAVGPSEPPMAKMKNGARAAVGGAACQGRAQDAEAWRLLGGFSLNKRSIQNSKCPEA